ncbi:MAG: ribosomal protein S18-alanine N-acetyltransferase [Methylotetracoccus sp.]|jgi:ribosomal-protein-alanine N-acetyltransferase|nr:ribosomal protein S18-alanine N-acetyltransferase [Methylotetracoccus sp.]
MIYDWLYRIKRWMSYDAEIDFYYRHFPSLIEQAEFGFRPMRRSDLSVISRIEESAYEFPWEPIAFRDCLSVGYNCWVGEKAGRILSYGIVTVGAGESHILNLCVAPEVQGSGYGRRTLEKLMEVAKGYRAEMVMLEVRPTNKTAIRLYRKMGFNEIGTRKDYYPAKNGREDALVLARML